jgi:hypothetical protein
MKTTTNKVTDAEVMELMDGVMKELKATDSIHRAMENVAGLLIKAVEASGIELDIIQKWNALFVIEKKAFFQYCVEYKRADLLERHFEQIEDKHHFEMEQSYCECEDCEAKAEELHELFETVKH